MYMDKSVMCHMNMYYFETKQLSTKQVKLITDAYNHNNMFMEMKHTDYLSRTNDFS